MKKEKKPNLIHRNCFEVIEPKKFINHVKTKFGHGMNYKKFEETYKNIKYLLRVEEVGTGFYSKKMMYFFKTDYFPVDEKLNLLEKPVAGVDAYFYHTGQTMIIQHQTMKYLLRNKIVRLLEENSPIYSKIILITNG